MSSADEFTLVTSKRQKSKTSKRHFCHLERFKNQNRNLFLFAADDAETFDKTVELKKITDSTLKILNSDYIKQTIEILSDEFSSPPSSIVCFGIGQIRHCHIARCQLAYILALKSYFKVKSIQFHEPLFSQQDTELINALDCEVFTTNIEGKLALDLTKTRSNTLVYLPHCPKQLTNNLLWKNWSPEALKYLILICNSFEFTIEQTPNSDLIQDAGFISRIEKYTREFRLRNSFESNNIFNDIAIHSFDTNDCEQNFFDDCVEPIYGISELIEATENLRIG